jgi:beta-galactosidase
MCEASGRIKITLKLIPNAVLYNGYIPAIGMMFELPETFNKIHWYGNGPWESYWDRKEGARLGLYEGIVKDQYAPHIVPQEGGNKTEVRRAEIQSSEANISFVGLPTFEFSALPYTPEEIFGHWHEYELPETHHTVVRINYHQMGIGGDRCWGTTPVAHAPYVLYANRVYEYAVEMGFRE